MRLFNKISYIYYDLKWSCRNIYKYIKCIINYRPWSFTDSFFILRLQLLDLISNTTNIEDIEKMNECVNLIDNIINDDYANMCGWDSNFNISFKRISDNLSEMVSDETEEQRENNRNAIINANKLRNDDWDNLFKIMSKHGREWFN